MVILLILDHSHGLRRQFGSRPSTYSGASNPKTFENELNTHLAVHNMSLFDVREPTTGKWLASGLAGFDNGAPAIQPQRLLKLRTTLFHTDWDGYLPITGPKFPWSWQIVSANVRAKSLSSPASTEKKGLNKEGWALLGSADGNQFEVNLNAPSRAFMAAHCSPSQGIEDSTKFLQSTEAKLPGSVAVESLSSIGRSICESQKAKLQNIRILSDRGSAIDLSEVRGPGILVLNDMYYTGWVAKDQIRGNSLPIYPANIAFKAIVLEEARPYRIEFSYQPLWLNPARGMTALAALVYFGWAAWLLFALSLKSFSVFSPSTAVHKA